MEAQLATLVNRAIAAPDAETPEADPTRERILDAALQEAASVGLGRLTVEDVVRRVRLGRMTVYRRFPRRDELVEALVVRECRRFLAVVAEGLARGEAGGESLAEGFVAAMHFAREHPLLRRLAQTEPGAVFETVAAGDALLMRMGTEFIVRRIQSDQQVEPSAEVRQAADVLARLFLTYVALPPGDPDPHDDAALRAFARDVLVPLVARAVELSRARAG